MLERTQVFVDTSYLLASFYNSWETGARAQLEIDLPEVVNVLGGMVQSQLGQPIQRQMWYDGIPDSGPHRYQRALRTCDGVQLRAGQLIEWGERRTQKAVDTRLVADMVIAGLRGQCSDIVLVSGDADMLPGVKEATAAGVRVHLYGFGWDSMSSALRHACDSTTILDPREDFADCMQLQVLEGPLPPVVRGKPVGDVEPPEDKGPTKVPTVGPHGPHQTAPAAPPVPDSQSTDTPPDTESRTDDTESRTDDSGVRTDDGCGETTPDTDSRPAADEQAAGEGDRNQPAADPGQPEADAGSTGDAADRPDQQAAADCAAVEPAPDSGQCAFTGDAATRADGGHSVDRHSVPTPPLAARDATGDEPAPDSASAATPATNAGVRQHPGEDLPSEEDARQRAIVNAHRDSKTPADTAGDISGEMTDTGEEVRQPDTDSDSGSAADDTDRAAEQNTAADDGAAGASAGQRSPSPGDVPKKTIPLPSMMAPKRRLNSRYVPVSNEVWGSGGFQTPYDVGQQYAIWWYDNAATEEQLDRAHELSGGSLPNEVDRPLLQFACERLHEYTLTDAQRVELRDGFHQGIRGVLLNRRDY
ncbi:NYN domain-containing protein [Corynebacterium mendelii]|uniref:NYN domain-containing protein n=1 Tax=Corynebacterium mendelii TaxID=2765362 RepID=A0A939E0E2_9CORY|nr:NYN domain-containing protein [Corynebacterium mendelii]MBN9644368.1 NYN domain-containing protein [Corynebacterium mendelii]